MYDEPPAAVPDVRALRTCWHPVGYAHEFADTPRRVRLLGENIAIWRDSAGVAHALRDLCIHRGTALSLGVSSVIVSCVPTTAGSTARMACAS